jgi:hypothetical protein
MACPNGSQSTTINAPTCATWTTCAVGTYIATLPTASSDLRCAACATGTFSATVNNGSCAPWTTCTPGSYVTNVPSAAADRRCAACPEGTYTTVANQSLCLATTDCPAGTIQTVAATPSSPAVCSACEAGQYCQGGTHGAEACSGSTWDDDGDPATPCVAKTDCLAGFHVSDGGSATTDRVCAACTSGTFTASSNQTTCTTWTTCQPGTYVSNTPSASADRVCTQCGTDTYSDETNAASCTPCPEGQHSGTGATSCSAGSPGTQQCFAAAGTYGNVTITHTGCGAPPWDPYTYHGRNGFALVADTTCTVGFSHAIDVSTITIDIDGNNVGDVTTISTSAGPYTAITADITGPLSSGAPPGTISATADGKITGDGSGTFRFTNSPPATITSITFGYVYSSGTFFRICANDGTPSSPE